MKEQLNSNKPDYSTILLKIKDEIFLLESIQELSINTINEIEILCHSANDEESEFNTIREKEGFVEVYGVQDLAGLDRVIVGKV